MQQYWPQSKVYLFGRFALAPPEELTGQRNDFTHYFPANSVGELIAKLREYGLGGYFKVEIMLGKGYIDRLDALLKMEARVDVGFSNSSWHMTIDKNYGLGSIYPKVKAKTPLTVSEVDELLKKPSVNTVSAKDYLQFKLTNINQQKFKNKLVAYLTDYQQDELTTGTETDPENFASQRVKLRDAAAKGYPQHGYKPTIRLADVWPSHASHTTFWELILTCQLLTDEIKIINMGYNDRPAQSLAAGISVPAHTGTVPFAKIQVISNELKHAIATSQSAPAGIVTTQQAPIARTFTAKVILSDRIISVELDDGRKFRISRQLRTDLAPDTFINYVLSRPHTPIGRQVIKEATGSSNITRLVRACGFTRPLKSIFFPGTNEQKVYFQPTQPLTESQVKLLTEHKWDKVR